MKINLFILGMQRGGTTSIFNLLKENKNISYTKIKETNLFSDKFFFNSNHNKHSSFKINLSTLNSYLSIKTNSKYLLESSVNHFYSKKAPKKIYDYNPGSKFIIIRRDPTQRIISHYYMDIRNNLNSLDLDQSIKKELYEDIRVGSDLGYLEMSYFKKYYNNWNQYFSRSNFLILDFKEFFYDSNSIRKLENFLSIKIDNKILKFNESINFKNKYYRDLFIFIKKILKIGSSSKVKRIINNLLFDNKKSDLDPKIKLDLEDYFKSDKEFFIGLKD